LTLFVLIGFVVLARVDKTRIVLFVKNKKRLQ